MLPAGSSMLRWLPKKFSKREQYFLQLLGIIWAAHVMLLAIALYRSNARPLAINVSGSLLRSDIPILVVPYVKRTGQLEQLARGMLKPSRVRGVGKQVKTQQVSSQHGSRNKPIVEQKQVLVQTQQPIKPKLVAAVIGKKAKKILVINEKLKNSVITPQEYTQKDSDKRVSEPVVQKKLEPTPLPPVALAQTSLAQTSPLDINLAAAVDAEVSDGTGPLVLGQQELEELQRYQEVQECMAPHWSPPIGLRVAKACVLLITVNAKGIIEQLVIEQPSGVLAYDMAARMAVHKTNLPASVWGQQIRLHF